MGYTTDFSGSIKVDPPLSKEEIDYLEKFSSTRRMNRANGPYFVEGDGDFGQGHGPDEVFNGNAPDKSQPSLWCQWLATEAGDFIEWDGNEKFYSADEWMKYIVDNFFGSKPLAASSEWTPDLPGHVLNGTIEAQGEDPEDMWQLIVKDNVVSIASGHVAYAAPVAL